MPFWQAEEYHQKYLAKMLSMNSMLYGEERKPIPP
jgi:peptide methionine sulfoxide reductase MsrA